MQKLTALALGAFLAGPVLSQSAPADTALYRQQVEAAVASYHQVMGLNADLYNGPEYMRYLPTIEGLPYYRADEWQPATIDYNGVVYTNVPVRYDLVKDVVVVRHPNGFQSFTLFSPRVRSFSLAGADFVYLVGEKGESAPAAGFYQVLTRGALTVLARRSRRIEEKLMERTQQFVSTDKFYVLKEGRYYSPRNEGDLLALAGERRKEARQALQQQHLRYKKAPEQAIMALAQFYNH